jgi:hypothetical protein
MVNDCPVPLKKNNAARYRVRMPTKVRFLRNGAGCGLICDGLRAFSPSVHVITNSDIGEVLLGVEAFSWANGNGCSDLVRKATKRSVANDMLENLIAG